MSGVLGAVSRSLILLVEHDGEVGTPLAGQLAADGYLARLARSAEHARHLARAAPPDALILGELDAPRGALELLAEVRAADRDRGARTPDAWPQRLPTIVLGAAPCELDLLRAFDAGADDFIARGASYLELRARLRALLARSVAPRPVALVRAGPLTIDTAAREVTLHGQRLVLRRLEFELLLALAREPQRVVSRDELMRLVWGSHATGTRTLDSHASRLRGKLRAAGAEQWLRSVRNVGYRLT